MQTMYFNHSAHIQLWDYLSKHEGAVKADWPGWADNGGLQCEPLNQCFACEACYKVCCNCPLDWTDYELEINADYCLDTFYERFTNAIDSKKYKEAMDIAASIRDLPLVKSEEIDLKVY